MVEMEYSLVPARKFQRKIERDVWDNLDCPYCDKGWTQDTKYRIYEGEVIHNSCYLKYLLHGEDKRHGD